VGGVPETDSCAKVAEDYVSVSKRAEQAKADIMMLNKSLLDVEERLNAALSSCSSLNDLAGVSGVVQKLKVRSTLLRVTRFHHGLRIESGRKRLREGLRLWVPRELDTT
jgi:hypothetical protein